jgi:hypothetical protein
MTCVSGHLTGLDIGSNYTNWSDPPEKLFFEAPVIQTIADVATLNPSIMNWR